MTPTPSGPAPAGQAPAGPARPAGPAPTSPLRTETRRALALARAEATLLLRNRTALFTALTMPLFFVVLFAALPSGVTGPAAVTSLVTGSALLFVVYYTLVTSVVARREQHTLKRLHTSPARPATVLVGMALPLLVLLVGQVVLGLVAAGVLTGLGAPPRLGLLVPAVLLGGAVWSVLALVSTVFTRSVESAQLSTMPLILVALLFSGLSLPLGLLPGALQVLAQLTPMFPVVDLVALAFTDVRVTAETVAGGALVRAVLVDGAVLLGWVAVGVALLRRQFRWEPRR
ncbi:ABC-2 type transport system permease protein [Friedmanniella luteola]|uniref:ABC-2 type transport system permease protein n=1 Tax=Friedmanniella luteola TaxID=546871 RepID=A0A1H1PIJ1_9ACTN|nr:ABC transporter permease [Friedmanniella luteola]SDS10499.1 ABC-2 type transport system permease protein [Friedmanniella luteola]